MHCTLRLPQVPDRCEALPGRRLDGQRHYARQMIDPGASKVMYFDSGWTPQLSGIQEFCQSQDFPSIDTDDPQTLNKSLSQLWAIKNASFKCDGTTPLIPESHAQTLHSYTVESALYKQVTFAMREANLIQLHSNEFSPFLDYIYFCHKALGSGTSIQIQNGINKRTGRPPVDFLYRGINAKVNAQAYAPGKLVVWQAFSSTSANIEVALNFMGVTEGQPSGTLFVIVNPKSPKFIAPWSQYPCEQEWTYDFNTSFRVLDNQDLRDVALSRHVSVLKGADVSSHAAIYVLEEIP